MSSKRVAAVLVSLAAGCGSKSAPNQDPPARASESPATPDKGLPKVTGMGAPDGTAAKKDDDRLHLQPEEGKLAIDVPADIKPGAESTATVKITPGAGYHVNVDYPIKLSLTPPSGMTLAKAELTKGDVNAFDEQHLVFDVKVTPAASGSYTVNGVLKFAVCTKDQCLPKKEAIAIAVAAK